MVSAVHPEFGTGGLIGDDLLRWVDGRSLGPVQQRRAIDWRAVRSVLSGALVAPASANLKGSAYVM
jgi:hypothetical protein